MSTTTTTTAAASGTFTIGGDLTVTRLGYGAMRLTGAGIWGEPVKGRDEAYKVLRRAVELGVDFIDTADAYGPEINEDIIFEALHPYDGVTIATKGGLTRQGPNRWEPVGRAHYLRHALELSLRRLHVERIDLWQFHRPDPQVPLDESYAEIAAMQRDGKIRHAGLSNVTIEQIKQAREHFAVASVQNRYNLTDRASDDVLDFCTAEGIAFIPWFPVAMGDLARPGSVVDTIAKDVGATPAQVALAWLLRRSPVVLPIPGTSSVAHVEENIAAAQVSLTDEQYDALSALG